MTILLQIIGAITLTYLYCRALLWFGREWEAMKEDMRA